MSILVQSRVWQESQHKGTALLLMLAIADFADDEGVAWPSVKTLAAKCRTTERSIHNLLHVLVDSGELTITRGGGRSRSNRYRIRLQALGQVPVKGEETSPFVEAENPEAGNTERVSVKPTPVQTLKNAAKTLKPASDKPLRRTTKSMNHHTEAPTEPLGPSPRDRRATLFLALLAECYGIPAEGLTKSERGRLNEAAKQLDDLGATPEEITRRADAYRQRWPSVELTPQALTSNWTTVGRDPPARPSAPRRGVPDYSGIAEFRRRMDEIESRGGIGDP